MGTTVRRISTAQGGNRIVIRQGACYRPGMKTSARDLGRLVRRMRATFDARFPMLAGLQFEHAWSGQLCLSRNAVSVMRELEPGLFSATACVLTIAGMDIVPRQIDHALHRQSKRPSH